MIETINQIADKWFQWQIAMLWQVAVLIVIVAGVDFLIKKWVWPQVRYALWLLVLVKLVMPPTLTSSTSITAMIPSLAEKTIQVQISKPVMTSQASVPEETIEPVSPVAAVAEPVESFLNPAQSPAEPVLSETIAQQSIVANTTESVSVSWKSFAFFVWLTGIVLLFAWLVMRLRRLRREQIREFSQENLPDRFDDILSASAKRLKLRRLPEVILTDKVSCPAVFGVFKPVLLMPADKIKNLTRQDAEHILLHELAHIKRGDLLVHAVYMFLQIAYWFNPLLWLIRKQVQNLRELCCDATVARHLKEKTSGYRETLLETARQLLAEPVDPGLGLLGLFESSNWLVDRLKWLEKRTWRNRPLRLAITFVLVVVMAGCILPMAKAAEFRVPEKFVGHWKGTSNIVVNWTKQRKMAIGIEIMADGKVEGQVGDSTLKDATFQRKNKFITDLFQHSTLYMIRGRLEGAIIKAEDVNRKSIGLLLTDVIDGRIEGGFHTSGQHFGNKKTMVLSGTDIKLEKAFSRNVSKTNFAAVLPNGATVELVGVCEHPSVGGQWWGIDGAVLPEAPYNTTGDESTSHKEGYKYYEFALKLSHPDTTSYYWMVPGSGHGSDTGSPHDKDGRAIHNLKAYAANLPKEQTTVNVRIGVTASQWQTVAAIKPADYEETIEVDEYSIAFGNPYEKDDRTWLPVVHNFNRNKRLCATRLVAITKSDKIRNSSVSGSGGNKLNSLTYSFRGLRMEQIKEFQFQTRTYMWATFNNVSLKPGFKTDAKVETDSVSESEISPKENLKVDFDSYFPDSTSGAQALEKLWNDRDKDLKDADEILETVRKGLRKYKGRGNILRWIGNLFIWGEDPQNEKAIELMYHASGSPNRGLYGDAIYFGLSVTKNKTPEILQAMAAVAMKTDDYYNVTGRILWGCRQQKNELIACLDPYLESNDEKVRKKAKDVKDYFTDSKAFMAKRAEDHVASVRSQHGGQLDQIMKKLLNGNSQTRLETLKEIKSKSIMSIIDESFLDAFAACIKDSAANVRNEAARMMANKFVWSGRPQNAKAIEILIPLLADPDRQVRGTAVYYGLSTVHNPDKELIEKMMATILDDREINYYGRVIGGLRRNKKDCVEYLQEWMDGADQDKQKALKAYEIYEDVMAQLLPQEYADRFSGQKSDAHEGLAAMYFSMQPVSRDKLKSQFLELIKESNLTEKILDFYIIEQRGSATAMFTCNNLADRNAIRTALTEDNDFKVAGYMHGLIGPTGSGWLHSLDNFRKANEANRESIP